MIQPPFFTVVIPLFNKRAFVARAVGSVLEQEDRDFELLVVDDGSTDASAEALSALHDERLGILRQENAGVGAARNAGMQAARGRWVAFLDADDAWWPDHLAELRRVAESFPDASLIGSGCLETWTSTLPPRPVPPFGGRIRKVDYFLEASRHIGFINASCAAVRRDVPARIGGFSPHRAGEDLEYWARIALTGEVAVSARITSAYFRATGGAMENLPRRSAPAPAAFQLADLSPSVAMLCARADADLRVGAHASIRKYVNARLKTAIRVSLYQGSYDLARRCSALMMPPYTRADRIYLFVTALPVVLQSALIAAYRRFVPAVRRIMGRSE